MIPDWVTTGVPGDEQQFHFQNATLQSNADDSIAFSIATHIEIPADITGTHPVAAYVAAALTTLAEHAESFGVTVRFQVQVGVNFPHHDNPEGEAH